MLPAEAVADVVSFLDRLSIERTLMVGRQFTQAADDLLASGNIPLRAFDSAGICFGSDGSVVFIANIVIGDVHKGFENADVWAYVVRWSTVRENGIGGFSFDTPVVTSRY